MLDSHSVPPQPRPAGRRLLRGAVLGLIALGLLPFLPASASAITLPPHGKVVRVSGMSAPSSLQTATPLTGTRLLTHRGNDNLANALDLTADVNGSVCRFPNFCFLADDNVGTTLETDEFRNCNGQTLDSTLWYVFEVPRRGLLEVVVNNTLPDPPTPFLPTFAIFNVNTADGFCGVASDVTTNFGDLFDVGPGSSLGGLVVMQVGARLTGAAGGTYDLNLRWDPDSDGDGLLDSGDDCDNEPGPAGQKGCPDSDNDGIRNLDDSCPSQAGPAQHAGCPDSDSDGIADRNDACASLSGLGTFGGCPDADEDGVPEGGRDKCPRVNPSRVDREDKKPRDGCPDLLRISANTRQLLAPLGNGVGIKSDPAGFMVIGVPKGARVDMRCKRPGGSRCGKLTVKRAATASIRSRVRAQAARNVSIRSRLPNTLPYGTVITVSVTARYAIGRYIKATIVRGDLISKKFLCIPAGKKKPRKRGGCR